MSSLIEKLKRRKSKETALDTVEVPSEIVSRLQRRIDRISKGGATSKQSKGGLQALESTEVSTQLAGEII
jgi:hypothetical protein